MTTTPAVLTVSDATRARLAAMTDAQLYRELRLWIETLVEFGPEYLMTWEHGTWFARRGRTIDLYEAELNRREGITGWAVIG